MNEQLPDPKMIKYRLEMLASGRAIKVPGGGDDEE